MSEIVGKLAGAALSGPVGGIITAVGAAAKTAAAIAEKSRNGQLIDAGMAQQHAADLEAALAKLQEFQNISATFDNDADFAEWVRSQTQED